MDLTAEKTSGAIFAALVALIVSSCGVDEPALDLETYEAELEQWRGERIANLKGPTGFLNLVGLYWLSDGYTTIGSAANNDIVFPAFAAAYIGELQSGPEGVKLVTASDVDVRYQDIPVTSILISDDTTESPVMLTHKTLAWTIIKRDERFALRLRDFEHPAIAAFVPIESYPIDASLRVTGTLNLFDEPKVMNVNTTIEGLGYHPESPGTVVFEIGGEAYELEAYASGDSLFFVFGDLTSGRETYPAGRFLYAKAPGDDGQAILDFNRAYNPPCAFNAFATCPVASPRNRLKTRIEAGEKYDPAVHSVPDGYN
jgi:uncharacterized protein (DUF1684 family)